MSSTVLCSHSSAADLNISKEAVIRSTVNFHRSIWGDRFLTYNEREDQAWEEQQAKELKEEVRKELVLTGSNGQMQHVKMIQLIDAVQRLGVAYHFEEEIEDTLKHIFVTYGDHWMDDCNLESTSVWFRLLRQQGFNVSSGIFKKYMDSKGNFMESVRKDVQGMLSLYEAAYMRVEGEEVLDAALAFTTFQLENIANDHMCKDASLKIQIEKALEQPLRKRLPRLEALRYIPIYQKEASHSEALLKFSILDFNLLQSLHQKELSQISKWWKNLDLQNKLPYVRDRLVEGYFWILAIYFEPQYYDVRIFLMKTCNLVIILDDTYDNYGTYEELEIFTEAVQRWSASCIDTLPEYMKSIYQELLDVHKEAEEVLERKGKAYHSYYTKEMVKEYTRNLLIEAKWAKECYIPTVEEHMSVTMVTCAYGMIIAKCYVYNNDLVTEDTFKWVSTYPPLVKASCLILRLMDDIATHEEEQERNHVASSIECYMKQYGVSEEQTREIFSKQVEDAWKVVNQESLRPTAIPRPLLMPPINLARVCDVLYKHGDDYNHAGKEMINIIESLLANPINVSV
ncbi:hypothetical protein L2E82_49525 [Cichorium intybus]|uniref:Uncharacterized protein n=2 Tax=Cichorium intybus TaxID=13427 RepID=A0ACB8Z1V7_CICIN|nr:hypothetical protein L2E82_49524 [Cichorium intybus]KAI3691261.1 hypothetical protein L2E82_49525 [Cichorium intybus]